ncbi:MAG: hypothetical protein GOU98_00940 [Candidatus Altiarchaeota archaeon]|nr:hypothetical protein [Candidatus Altiarchaeota archaeon]
METASFIVETSDWKSLFKMRYDGNTEKLLAFGALVEGTIHYKMGDLFPNLKKEVESLTPEIEDVVKQFASIARKAIKNAEISKDYRGFAKLWVVAELLNKSGLQIFPEKKELRKILKRI